MQLGRPDAALARLGRLAAAAERPKIFLKRRGDRLVSLGSAAEARAAYTEALAAVGRLPAWIRNDEPTRLLIAQLATPTGMVVCWRTDTTESSVVRYGLTADRLTRSAKAEGVGTEHVVQLSKLEPATRYFYAPVTGNDKSKPGGEDPTPTGRISSFVTPPLPGPAQPTRVRVLGDPGTKNATQAAVRDALKKFAGTRPAHLWLMLGDKTYPDGTDTDYQQAVFDVYPAAARTTCAPTFSPSSRPAASISSSPVAPTSTKAPACSTALRQERP